MYRGFIVFYLLSKFCPMLGLAAAPSSLVSLSLLAWCVGGIAIVGLWLIMHLRIMPLAFASGHGRYIGVTTGRALVSVGEWPLHIMTVNRFASETALCSKIVVSLLKPKPPCSGSRNKTAA